MMNFARRLLLSVFVFVASACSRNEPPYNDDSRDGELYAQTMRRTVLMLVQRARNGDRATQMGIIAEELSHSDRPFGDYRSVFLEMREVANDALEVCRDTSETQKPAIDAQLDDLVRLAKELPENPDAPGDVIPEK